MKTQLVVFHVDPVNVHTKKLQYQCQSEHCSLRKG